MVSEHNVHNLLFVVEGCCFRWLGNRQFVQIVTHLLASQFSLFAEALLPFIRERELFTGINHQGQGSTHVNRTNVN